MEIVDRVYVALDALEAVGRPGEIGAEQLSSVDVRFQQHRKRLALAEMGRFLDCLTGRPMADLGRVQSDCFAITASASRIGCTGWFPVRPLSRTQWENQTFSSRHAYSKEERQPWSCCTLSTISNDVAW
jgi:hypothetical protein